MPYDDKTHRALCACSSLPHELCVRAIQGAIVLRCAYGALRSETRCNGQKGTVGVQRLSEQTACYRSTSANATFGSDTRLVAAGPRGQAPPPQRRYASRGSARPHGTRRTAPAQSAASTALANRRPPGRAGCQMCHALFGRPAAASGRAMRGSQTRPPLGSSRGD